MRDALKCRLAIHSARSHGEVLTAVNGYLSSLSQEDQACLPESLRAVTAAGAEEVVGAAAMFASALENASNHSRSIALLKDVASVVSLGAMRISILSLGLDPA